MIQFESGNGSTTTAATGTNWTALPSHQTKEVSFVNLSGTSISVRYGAGVGLSLPNGTGFTFKGVTNTNQLQVKRTDNSNTQVAVQWNYTNQ